MMPENAYLFSPRLWLPPWRRWNSHCYGDFSALFFRYLTRCLDGLPDGDDDDEEKDDNDDDDEEEEKSSLFRSVQE